MTPKTNELLFCALGGSGEIGMNVNLYGHAGKWLMVDLGVTFADAAYPGIEIRSVTSGFPSKELGVGVAHPAFPHEINKVFEIVESAPSPITQLMWALGLLPMEVSDDWSFILDVLFCGVTNAALRHHGASNMPYWKIDKFVRKFFGPNPMRAHDAIGAKGANFLTWSCLHHLKTRVPSRG